MLRVVAICAVALGCHLIADATADSEERFCSRPPDIDGFISPVLENDSFPIGSIINYQCKFGYVSRSSSSLLSVCRTGEHSGKAEWIPPNTTCIPRSCGDPGYIVNGRRVGNLFTFPNNVKYECLEGYKLQGLKDRYCQANGEWSGILPTCAPIRCPVPPNLKNGRVIYSSLDYGTELEYQCDKGFMLQNHKTRICNEEGIWSNDEPECIETSCGIPEAPEYGSVQLYDELPKVGTLVFYFCDDDATLVGASTAKCLSSGDWTFDPPKCLRSCDVTEIENGNLGRIQWKTRRRQEFIPLNVGENVKHHETVTLQCKEGYSPGNRTRSRMLEVECNDGTWSEPLHCYPMLCSGDPPIVANASPVISSRMHGDTIWYKCDEGYQRVKRGKVICQYGKWEGPTPACADYRCYMEELNYPGLLKPQTSYINHGHHFKLSCEKAYTVSSWKKQVSCLEGNWDITKNPCKLKTCEDEPPRLNNGKPKDFSRVNGSVVDYECEDSYEMEGASSVICAFGAWIGEPPVCNPPKEILGKAAANGELENNNATINSFNPTPDYLQTEECYCSYNYRTDLLNVYFRNERIGNHEKIRKGEKVSFACLYPGMDIVWQNGLRFFEKMDLTCNRCHDWQIHQLPVCEGRVPGDSFIVNQNLNLLPGGIIEVPKSESIYLVCANPWMQPRWNTSSTRRVIVKDYPETVSQTGNFREDIIIYEMDYDHIGRYECFGMHGDRKMRSAVIDLKISGSDVLCPELSTENGQDSFEIIYSNDKKIHSKAYYKCKDPLKKIVGNNERICLENGQWSHSSPSCQDIRCPLLNENSDFIITYNNRRKVNSLAFYSCKTSRQRVIGSSNRTCLHSGEWSGTNPVCEDITCPEFLMYNGLSVVYSRGTKVGSIASFSCLNHATLVGSSYASCLDNGTWSHPRPSCEMLEIHCPKIDGKGTFTIQYSNNRTVNSTALFFCKAPNKKVAGCNFMTCQQNGEWSGDYPTCIDYVTCESFPVSPNLNVHYSDGGSVGSVASFQCLYPTSLEGSSFATCLSDGNWSHSLPRCIAPDCSIHDLTMSLPETLHPDMENITSEFVIPGSELPLICEDDLVLTGSSTVLCNLRGEWESTDTQCISACRVNKQETSNLIVEPVKDYYRFAEFILLSCPPGQKLTSDVERMICLGTTWSDALPDCTEMTEPNLSGYTQTTMKSR